MITLLTAVPGSGKTLYSIGLILAAIKEGRPVYANIAGLKIDKCYPAPDDWRETPEGALVIYDEAQQPHLYPSTASRGDIKDDRLRSMEVHRHTGHDLVFISQSPSFIHHHIRKLAGEHIHLYRTLGLQTATVYKWQHVVDNPNDRGEQSRSDSYPWKFPKEYYKLYQSATVHTHKFKLPRKLAALLVFIALVASAVFYNAYTNEASLLTGSTSTDDAPPQTLAGSGGVRGAPTTDRPASIPAQTTKYDWSDIQTATPVAGCIFTDKKCQCFSPAGHVIKMDYAQCLSAAKSDQPRSIVLGGNQSRSSKSAPSSSSPSDANPFAALDKPLATR
jgi:zona occludens toxin (predicted ATPase)